MSENIEIRRAKPGDVDRIVRLTNAGGPDGKPKKVLLDPLPEGYFAAFRRISADSNHALMVAEIDGKIIGTLHLTFVTYMAGAGREDCHVEAVHVDKCWQGRGCGTAMMEWAILEAKRRGCRRMQLTTNKQRKDAHRFYERLGFSLSHEGAKLEL